MKNKVKLGGGACYSSRDLARIFSVNESTIKRWADSGKIRCFRTVGRHRRFPFEVVSEFVEKYQMEVSLSPDSTKEAFRK